MNAQYQEREYPGYLFIEDEMQATAPQEQEIEVKLFESVGLNADTPKPAERKIGFWRRQFQDAPTQMQNGFSWAFGVVLPLVCFLFDPIVFKEGFDKPLLGAFKPFAYLLSFTSILAMSAWLLWGKKLGSIGSFLAGLFAVGSLVAFVVGLVLAPFSLIGLVLLIGVLGFTPLVTGFVYLRESIRAFRVSRTFTVKGEGVRSFALGALLLATIPFVANVEISHLVKEMLTADAETIESDAALLRFVAPLVDMEPVASKYRYTFGNEHNSPRMWALADAYWKITGKPIDSHYFD